MVIQPDVLRLNGGAGLLPAMKVGRRSRISATSTTDVQHKRACQFGRIALHQDALQSGQVFLQQ